MAYMGAIVTVSQEYVGLAWVRYDSTFCRQVAFTGNTHWSTINSICFTGRATSTPQCELCFASTHTAKECAQKGDPDPGLQDQLKAIETVALALTSKSPVTWMTTPKMVCILECFVIIPTLFLDFCRPANPYILLHF